MMDSATNVISKENVEHAKELVQDVLSDITEKVRETDLVQHLRPVKKTKRKMSRAFLMLLVVVGAGALVAYALRRQSRSSNGNDRDIAPDPFGTALEEERSAIRIGNSTSTPGV
jgi:hypothetical protein